MRISELVMQRVNQIINLQPWTEQVGVVTDAIDDNLWRTALVDKTWVKAAKFKQTQRQDIEACNNDDRHKTVTVQCYDFTTTTRLISRYVRNPLETEHMSTTVTELIQWTHTQYKTAAETISNGRDEL